MFFLCVTDSALCCPPPLTLLLLHKPLLPHFPSVMIVCLLKILLVLGGLWKIYSRWAVFEGYVFSNYLYAEGFQ